MPGTNLINKAKQLKKCLNGASTRDVAKRLGLSHSSIAQTLALLKLSVPVQKLLQDSKISKTHVRLLCPLPPDKQLHFANLVVSLKLSVRALEAAIKGTRQRNVSPDTKRLERLISEKLGAPVMFDERKKEMVIKYQDLEVLDGVLENMGINVNNEGC
jgi:ParB-like chromosome segregation protein Spo0J